MRSCSGMWNSKASDAVCTQSGNNRTLQSGLSRPFRSAVARQGDQQFRGTRIGEREGISGSTEEHYAGSAFVSLILRCYT